MVQLPSLSASHTQILQHLEARHQTTAAGFFDFEGAKEATAEVGLDVFDGAVGSAGEWNEAPGAAIVAAGLAAQAGDDLAEHFAGLSARLIGPHGKDHLAA